MQMSMNAVLNAGLSGLKSSQRSRSSTPFCTIARLVRHVSSPFCASLISQQKRHHTTQDHGADQSDDDHIDVTWKLKDGTLKETRVKIGTNIMWAARFNDIELEGACEGVCACR